LYCLAVALLTATSAFAGSLLQSTQALPNHSTVIGKIGNKDIHLGDIENRDINKLRIQLYEAIMVAFQQSAAKTLVDENTKYSEFKPQKIAENDIEAFFYSNQLQRKGSLEQLRPQIRAYMEGMVSARLNNQIFGAALDQRDLTSYLYEPEAFTVEIPVETAYLRGNEQATTMLMEFSDFQCPFCQRVQPTIQKLLAKYGEKMSFGYRHFPLEFHSDADDAAIAIECARDQGKFDDMHGLLFKQQKNQSREELKKLASQIDLKDMDAFNQCLDNNKYETRVARDIQVGQSVGITGTPGFIIGRYDPKSGILKGELLSGARPEVEFENMVSKYLAK